MEDWDGVRSGVWRRVSEVKWVYWDLEFGTWDLGSDLLLGFAFGYVACVAL